MLKAGTEGQASTSSLLTVISKLVKEPQTLQPLVDSLQSPELDQSHAEALHSNVVSVLADSGVDVPEIEGGLHQIMDGIRSARERLGAVLKMLEFAAGSVAAGDGVDAHGLA
eukprot:COSAG01_NODE_1817_length_9164_cov_20.194264_1_plen_111_part_10